MLENLTMLNVGTKAAERSARTQRNLRLWAASERKPRGPRRTN